MTSSYFVDGISLRKAAIERGYNTVTSFAKACEISVPTARGVFRGTILPNSLVIRKISEVLEFDSETTGRVFFAKKLT